MNSLSNLENTHKDGFQLVIIYLQLMLNIIKFCQKLRSKEKSTISLSSSFLFVETVL